MVAPSVLVLPQWQGSIAPHAPRMTAGAAQLAELARAAGAVPHTVGGLPPDRSPARDGVASLDVLLAARATIEPVIQGGPVLALGGDCGADLMVAARQLRDRDGDLALLWIDAHADFNTPASSPSGAFHGMVARSLTGTGPAGLLPAVPAPPSALVLTGTRSVDPLESEALAAAGVAQLGMRALTDPELAVAALRRTGRSAVHVHLDLDVLDPGVFADTVYQIPGGATVEHVSALLTAVGSALPVASAFIGEHLGGDPAVTAIADPLLRRLLTLLTS